MLTSANLAALVPAASEALGLDENTVSLVAMPLFHVAGAGWALFGLMNGAHNVMLRDVDLAVILDTIPRYGITHAVFVPAVLQFMLATPGVEDTDFSTLETIVYGASPISEAVLVAAMERFGCGFVQAYGLTETSGGVVLLHPEDHDPGGPLAHRLRAAGRPMRGVELRIASADGTALATGEIGEVWISSPSTMTGYWERPEATAEAITPDGWFRSGDAGRVDADGYLYIEDRVKDMIITGGENVFPAEVESVLMGHPAVADAAVIGVPDDRWGETVKAIVVPAPGTPDDAGRGARSGASCSRGAASASRATSARRRSTGSTSCPGTLRARSSSASFERRTGPTATARSASGSPRARRTTGTASRRTPRHPPARPPIRRLERAPLLRPRAGPRATRRVRRGAGASPRGTPGSGPRRAW